MRAPITDKHLLEMMWERFPEIMKRGIEQPAQQEPVALKWQQSPIRTAWGDDMVVASVAIDNDHTLSLYCERDQAPKVEAMFAQRTWVELTDREIDELWMSQHDDFGNPLSATGYERAIEAKLKEKNT